MQLYHDSRDAAYRFPGGALPCGTTACLRLTVSARQEPVSVVLRVWNGGEHRIAMSQVRAADGAWLYEAALAVGDVPITLWYRFEVEADGETAWYGNAADHLGGVGLQGTGDGYQITVYDAASVSPAWLREGVMYQIMVDRFYNGDPTGQLIKARQDITLHSDWYEPPTLDIADNGDNRALDFFGGNLQGIREKLPYLQSLGVTTLYLNPIFQSRSNHKYDTGDYSRIDPMFGTEDDFMALCESARQAGMRVLLDGVFSHVGSDSRYFNRFGTYDAVGAYQSPDSPYYAWFSFQHYPDAYDCWWGFDTLPNVRETEPAYVDYMLTGKHAIVPGWIQKGASGWRLDVADELPMPFLRTLRQAAKRAHPDAVVLGEVWEDASNKCSYGEMRNYTIGDTLDTVMNYPLRELIISFLTGGESAAHIKRRLDALAENYPRPFFYSLMNLLGSHDRARIINVLAGRTGEDLPRPERRDMRLTDGELRVGSARVRLMLQLICALPGIPCVYYGDEAGMQGAPDPFCRATYPWGREDAAQVAFFAEQLTRRRAMQVLQSGELLLLAPSDDVLVVVRTIADGRDAFGQPAKNALALVAVNRSDAPCTVQVLADQVGAQSLVGEDGQITSANRGAFRLTLPAMSGELWQRTK